MLYNILFRVILERRGLEMQDREKIQIRVGIFVLLGLILGMYFIFMIGGEKQLFEQRYTLNTKFKDISGLRVGAPIQLAGLKVGFVDSIKFSPDLTQKDVEIALKINKKFQDRIRKDSEAAINTQGLLGDKFVYISVGSETELVLQDGDFLAGREVASLYSIAEKGGEILENVKEASTSAKKFFEDMYAGKENIRESLQSLRNIMHQTEKGEGLLNALIYDSKGREVVADIADSMESLKNIVGRADEEDKKNGEASGVVKNLRVASEDLKQIVAKVNRGEGTIGGLIADPTIYNDIRALFGRANRNKLLKTVVKATLTENDKKILKKE
ncbi:MAG: MCE family protein [Deltaproteobacteria bacterium]|nr:MCE family protein [Deltaproteobacteria bacterium]